MSKCVLPLVSSRSFIVFGLTLKSIIHFSFFFFNMVIQKFFYFILLHIAIVFSQHHLMKRLLFLLCIFLPHSLQISWPLSVWVHFWAFCLVPFIYVSVFVLVLYCFYYCSFVVESEVRECDYSSSVFSQDYFGYSGSFVLPYELWNFCSSSVKNAIGNLIGVASNLQIAFGSIVIFTILILSTQEHGIPLHLFMSSLISFLSVL